MWHPAPDSATSHPPIPLAPTDLLKVSTATHTAPTAAEREPGLRERAAEIFFMPTTHTAWSCGWLLVSFSRRQFITGNGRLVRLAASLSGGGTAAAYGRLHPHMRLERSRTDRLHCRVGLLLRFLAVGCCSAGGCPQPNSRPRGHQCYYPTRRGTAHALGPSHCRSPSVWLLSVGASTSS